MPRLLFLYFYFISFLSLSLPLYIFPSLYSFLVHNLSFFALPLSLFLILFLTPTSTHAYLPLFPSSLKIISQVLISSGVWMRLRFGGTAALLGRESLLNFMVVKTCHPGRRSLSRQQLPPNTGLSLSVSESPSNDFIYLKAHFPAKSTSDKLQCQSSAWAWMGCGLRELAGEPGSLTPSLITSFPE